MSFPDNETTRASIKYQNKIYRMFNNPVNDEIMKKYNQVKKGSCSAPWIARDFVWTVKNNKLYLCKIYLILENRDITKDIIQNELFADWVNEDLKLFISKEPYIFPQRKRKVLILEVKNGIVENSYEKTEIYEINGRKRILWEYMQKFVGHFWIYENKVYVIKDEIEKAVKINDVYKLNSSFKGSWEKLKNENYLFDCFEYYELPRGEVVYNEKTGSYIINANENILKSDLLKYRIIRQFELDKDLVEFNILKDDTI
ncbi:hypothetical protein C3L23_02135 [Nautilia sp. PV-1]|uniref:hypothetical protein n=1 Tax=Nautilia sp. PV-1 TaxID=2579250 RepID=UPI000FD6F8B4|nr:hypothetical protein [Nautilia sp. PV-1]AZV46111.1 hypothetical protein C3L23_02135 [Nautilia sp. PV-1]